MSPSGWKSGHFQKLSPPPFTMELANDHVFLDSGTMSKFLRAGFLIFGLVFVSHDCEVGRNVCSEE